MYEDMFCKSKKKSKLYSRINIFCKLKKMTFNQEARLENGDIAAVMKTTNGTMTIKLFTEQAPKTTLNFMGLAQKGYYNGIIFHRIIKGFIRSTKR